jgi:hypothetical protein
VCVRACVSAANVTGRMGNLAKSKQNIPDSFQYRVYISFSINSLNSLGDMERRDLPILC